MATLTCVREITIEKPAEEIWDWVSNLDNIMTLNQFHVAIDYDAGGESPKRGLAVPLHHDFFGYKHVRMATIQAYGDHKIGWGERHVAEVEGEGDPFPHSEAWWIESLGPDRSLVRTSLRGSMQWGPLTSVLADYLWSILIPPILDTDLKTLAWRLGGGGEEPTLELSPHTLFVNRLLAAREIDGQPVEKLMADFLPEGMIKPGIPLDADKAFLPVN
ncbi:MULTISPECIES: hypothetical protein [unclassified Pseudofrankia]|uniref:hypothetical protein n=1 Tax=unclassified Pseudofrankia TaxID=2994372 RepID=UPI0008DB1EA6|nr:MULTISPECIES: hypothetical protein [unclassified Pseudofrankia]MDT3442182.1 hypothetical protein [Pseudofrankia sp. BMG5.37]OHV43601.1 hypothetical protein BCD48_27920 [Pseudofrankia sp. BMG5.36]